MSKANGKALRDSTNDFVLEDHRDEVAAITQRAQLAIATSSFWVKLTGVQLGIAAQLC